MQQNSKMLHFASLCLSRTEIKLVFGLELRIDFEVYDWDVCLNYSELHICKHSLQNVFRKSAEHPSCINHTDALAFSFLQKKLHCKKIIIPPRCYPSINSLYTRVKNSTNRGKTGPAVEPFIRHYFHDYQMVLKFRGPTS